MMTMTQMMMINDDDDEKWIIIMACANHACSSRRSITFVAEHCRCTYVVPPQQLIMLHAPWAKANINGRPAKQPPRTDPILTQQPHPTRNNYQRQRPVPTYRPAGPARPRYSCPTGRARPDPARARSGPARSGPARLARITNRAGPGRPTCPALCTSTARGPVWRAGPARYARRASWAVPARARLGICTRLPLSQLRMISRFQI